MPALFGDRAKIPHFQTPKSLYIKLPPPPVFSHLYFIQFTAPSPHPFSPLRHFILFPLSAHLCFLPFHPLLSLSLLSIFFSPFLTYLFSFYTGVTQSTSFKVFFHQ